MSEPGTTEKLFSSEGGGHSYRVKLQAFEGPLDLLLHLIRKNQLDIYDIPISLITKQYLEYLSAMKELNLDIAGEFIVMASTLVQIKSRMLLPVQPEEDLSEEEVEDPRAELVRRLLEYQCYRDAAGQLDANFLLGRDVFIRSADTVELEDLPGDEQLVEVDLFQLVAAVQKILEKLPAQIAHEVHSDTIKVADRINDILTVLHEKDMVTFEELFLAGCNRDYIVTSFLAILELCKMRLVKIFQDTDFSTIWLRLSVTDSMEHHDGDREEQG
jgi:segregation and condensation protein A